VRVRVRLFARYREAAGREHLDVELPEGATVESAWAAVVGSHPELSPFRPFTLFAVGHEYVPPEHPLRPDDELCLFPPVSGGRAADVYRVVGTPLSADAAAAAVDDPGAGGIVIFSGVVRDETGGRPVKFLEYEAHAPMAEAKLREIDGTLEELNKISGDTPIYKSIGMLLVRQDDRDALKKELEEHKETLTIRVKSLQKQEKSFAERYEGLGEKIQAALGGPPATPEGG